MFGWGNSEYGQLLPKSDIQQIHTPTHLNKCLGLGKLTDVASGGSFCMALNGKFTKLLSLLFSYLVALLLQIKEVFSFGATACWD